jgi:hypothetical protein
VASHERTTASERWILRLSQTISHRTSEAALLSKLRRKRAKSFSVRVLPITPSTLSVATSKAAIRVCLARHHRQSWRDALEGLDTGHLVDGDGAMGVIGGGRGRGFVDRADVRALGGEGGIGLRGQPIADAMRFEVGLFFKKRPTERCEMFGTRSVGHVVKVGFRWNSTYAETV